MLGQNVFRGRPIGFGDGCFNLRQVWLRHIHQGEELFVVESRAGGRSGRRNGGGSEPAAKEDSSDGCADHTVFRRFRPFGHSDEPKSSSVYLLADSSMGFSFSNAACRR